MPALLGPPYAPPVIVRPARPEELAAVGSLTLASYVADGHLTPTDSYAEELTAADRRSAEAELMVAADGDALLGTVTYCLAGTPWAEIALPGEAEFRMLAVAPDARRRGVGRELATWCVARAQTQGCAGMVLCSLPSMTGAHRLYESMGFRREPDRDWWPRPELHLLAFTLALT